MLTFALTQIGRRFDEAPIAGQIETFEHGKEVDSVNGDGGKISARETREENVTAHEK